MDNVQAPVDAASTSGFLGMFNSSVDTKENLTINTNEQTNSPETETVAKSGEVPAKDLDQGGNTESGNQEMTDAKENPERMQFWQSRADKYKAELDALKSQEPVLKYLAENPEKATKVYDVLLDKGSSGQVNSNRPQRPERPQKPADYNHEDAIADPTSDSFKYKQSLDEFQMKLVEYQDELALYQEKTQQQKQQEMFQVQQQQKALESVMQEAVYVHGLENKDAQEFISWAQNPNYDMGTLIQVYKAQKGASAAAHNKVQMVNSRVQAVVPPVVNGSNVNVQQQAEPEVSDDQAFFNSMFNYAKGRR
jgi:hypothetical protein